MTSSGPTESLKNLLETLESSEDVQKTLEKLNSMLATSPAAAQAALKMIPLPLLFSFLQTKDISQVQVLCSVLDKLLCLLPGSDLVQHATYMELGLQYTESRLVRTCLLALKQHCGEEPVRTMVTAPTMLHLVCQILSGQDLECVMLASKILQTVFSGEAKAMSVDVFVEELRALLSQDSVVQMRVYDLCVQLCQQGGPTTAKTLMEAGFLQGLVKQLDSEDMLIKLNVVELLCAMTDNEQGRQFVNTTKVPEKLHRLLQACKEDAFGAILVPALLKFFGQLCLALGREAAQLSHSFPEFLGVALEAAMNPSDMTLWGLAVDTVGLLTSFPAGREVLMSREQASLQVLASWGQVLVSSSSEKRCRILRAIKMLASCEERVSRWKESKSLRWLTVVHPSFFKQLMAVIRQPFPDLYSAGLGVVLEMSKWHWGQQEMRSFPGFLEFLLDRGSVPGKEGQQLKYEVVCSCVNSECGEVWGGVDMLRLRKYQREGPFYKETETSIALDNS